MIVVILYRSMKFLLQSAPTKFAYFLAVLPAIIKSKNSERVN